MHQQTDELDELLKSIFSSQLSDLEESINTNLNKSSNRTEEQTNKISRLLRNIEEKFPDDEYPIENTIQEL